MGPQSRKMGPACTLGALPAGGLGDPTIAGLKGGGGGLLAVGKMHGYHAGTAGTGELQEAAQVGQAALHAGIGSAGGLTTGGGGFGEADA